MSTSAARPRTIIAALGRRRLITGVTALALTAGVAVVPANPASALPPPGGNPAATWDATITGSLSLSGCTADANQVMVKLSANANGALYSDVATLTPVNGDPVTHKAATLFTFEAIDVPHKVISVQASVTSPSCKYGHFSVNPRNVTVPITPGVTVAMGKISFTAAKKVTKVDSFLIESAARSAMANLFVDLNDYGPQHGLSHQLDNSSRISVDGHEQTFTIPETLIKLQNCKIFCVSAGTARYYVASMYEDSVSFNWASSGVLNSSVHFESIGPELKGFYDNWIVGSQDDLMPDIELDNASLSVPMVPVADGNGGVTFALWGAPSFHADISADGPCTVFSFDICNFFLGYSDTITSTVGGAMTTLMSAPSTRQAISDGVRPALDGLGIGAVTGVFIEGNEVVFAE